MILFDQNPAMDDFNTAYVKTKIPADVQVERFPGGTGEITLSTGESISCVAGLADGTVDLMVNITQNKGLDVPEVGNFTLSMKNHLGSMRFPEGHRDIPGGQDRAMETIIAMNQSDAVLGGDPPRQQLCIMDSLWAMNGGPYGIPDKSPYCLAMGTFGPIMDYLIIRKIREEAPESEGGRPWGMGVTDTVQDCVDQMVNGFGYDINSDEISNLDFVDALTYESPVSAERIHPSVIGSVAVSLSIPSRPSFIRFYPVELTRAPIISIYDMRGRRVRSLTVPAVRQNQTTITWDGRDRGGVPARSAAYIITLDTGKYVLSQKVVL
jgi:hypothetical protein